jgi:ankyrin repeat protein
MNVLENLNKYNNQIFKLFNLIKLKNWKSLDKFITNNKMDYNIKDESNVYLIEYLVLNNQIGIIKLLLKQNIRIDIIDENKQSLLYNIIKYSQIDILKLFIEYNSKIIGKNILELRDKNGDIPLFYAIKRNNKKCIEIIINNMTNFTIKNLQGENIYQLCIECGNLDILKIIINKYQNINYCNALGENILQIIIKNKKCEIFQYILKNYIDKININHIENKYNYSVLHYLFILNNFKLIQLYFDYVDINKLNVNIQDVSGNTFYHYYLYNINENALKIYDLIKKLPIDYDLFNIDGDTSCHVLIDYYDKFIDYKIIINDTIEKSNINIQNTIGNSCLFLIIKENIWKNIFDLLQNKKLNIFILNRKKQSVFDFISKNILFDKFIDLITKSYINQLNKSNSWTNSWDKKCCENSNLKINDLSKNELQQIEFIDEKFKNNEYINKNNKNNKNNICYKYFYSKIFEYSKEFIKTKNIYKKYSYPTNTDIIKLIPTYLNITMSTYTGSTLDIFCGLLYLQEKFNQKTVTINTSLKLINTNDNNIINCNNININNNKKICEIFGFEILWKNYKLFIPSTKQNDLQRTIINMKHNKIQYLLVPIGIEINNDGTLIEHANFLIFDINNNQVERFEPHGSDSPFELNAKLFDETLQNKLKFLNFEYISPYDYLPKIGFQSKEMHELDTNYIGDPNGFCALWCVWWCDMRISNPNYSRNKLFKLLTNEITNENYLYKKIIRDYGYYITNMRDNILKKINANVNDWMNDNIDNENINKLNNLLIKKILKKY